ncbi:MAG: type II CRISPR-associated endonuclease Cas1 [Bdellovibrionaceae bacterium]|nr:type II CRISPR-associated endonuclease Cas1 [Pseudobdellovibrionaceae bacterium]
MSFHVLHLLEPGIHLRKNRGRLEGQFPDGTIKSLPVENIKAIIALSRTLTMSIQLVGELLDQGTIVLFCNRKYKPSGWLVPLVRTIHPEVHRNQYLAPSKFKQSIWSRLVRTKFENQNFVLQQLGLGQIVFDFIKNNSEITYEEEARVAKTYFRAYFSTNRFHNEKRSEKKKPFAEDTDLNSFLNYGYAVLSSFIHRSAIIHGLLPVVGVQHRARYNSYPLVYDTMEPFRPVVDLIVAGYLQQTEKEKADIRDFVRYLSKAFVEIRFKKSTGSLKFIDVIDFYIRSLQLTFLEMNTDKIWLPSLRDLKEA